MIRQSWISGGIAVLLFGMVLLGVQGCGGASNAVTIYTSVDRDYAEPVIAAYQEQNPELKVNAIYDSEMTKTTGLFNRLLEERRNPQADVFWNSEIVRTIQLKNEGVLEAYTSPAAQDIPDQYKDPEGYWTGFSVRARVMLINQTLVPETETPASVPAMGKDIYQGKTAGMATPQFGTTATHMAALYTLWGKERFTLIIKTIQGRGIKMFPGNASVRDAVVEGIIAYGLTDTDDSYAALEEGKPVRMAFVDQGEQEVGTLVIPNTVALIKGGPNPENGKKLIDYLLSPAVEEQLAQSRAKQIPVRDAIPRPEGVPDLSTIKTITVDYNQVAQNMEPCLELLRTIFR
ncbi:MAG TPA: extracellular solute-binding protein [bacterium]|nr:extracellular solute-binding protein [bacterium]HPO99882.1 extracellular solute-binding protein [bacterium]HXK94969.1 extracellular solute-binding protein [bacterium]